MPAPGEIFGHYRLEERLGGGAFGTVFRGEDIRLHRKVAVKILNARGDEDPESWGRLLEEARAASALHHPNICSIFDIGEESGLNYIALEYIEGRPLSEIIHQGPLPVLTALSYAAQMAKALAHAHNRRIVHRDLKASNVMITAEGHAALLDFGLARRLDSQVIESVTQSRQSLADIGSLAGTLCYMAPEVLRGRAAGPRSDLWSLGALLHEMLSGGLPFKGETPFELSLAIMVEGPQALPPGVPAGIRVLVEKCLQKQPRKRYAKAEEILAGLEAARAQLERAQRSRNFLRRPWMLAAGLFLIVALALALAWHRYHRQTAQAATPKVEVVRSPAAPPSAASQAPTSSAPGLAAEHPQKKPASRASRDLPVWVNTKSGIYHCTKPARYNPDHWQTMPLSQAKQHYRQAKGKPCQ